MNVAQGCAMLSAYSKWNKAMNRLILVLGVLVVLVMSVGVYLSNQGAQKTAQIQAHLDAQAKKESDRAARQAQLQAESDAVLRQGEHSPNKPVVAKTPEEIRQAERDAQSEEYEMQYAIEQTLRQASRDPDSIQFQNQSGGCGQVNTKNGFGGYTGFKRYAFDGESLLIEGGKTPYGVLITSDEMDIIWRKYCT